MEDERDEEQLEAVAEDEATDTENAEATDLPLAAVDVFLKKRTLAAVATFLNGKGERTTRGEAFSETAALKFLHRARTRLGAEKRRDLQSALEERAEKAKKARRAIEHAKRAERVRTDPEYHEKLKRQGREYTQRRAKDPKRRQTLNERKRREYHKRMSDPTRRESERDRLHANSREWYRKNVQGPENVERRTAMRARANENRRARRQDPAYVSKQNEKEREAYAENRHGKAERIRERERKKRQAGIAAIRELAKRDAHIRALEAERDSLREQLLAFAVDASVTEAERAKRAAVEARLVQVEAELAAEKEGRRADVAEKDQALEQLRAKLAAAEKDLADEKAKRAAAPMFADSQRIAKLESELETLRSELRSRQGSSSTEPPTKRRREKTQDRHESYLDDVESALAEANPFVRPTEGQLRNSDGGLDRVSDFIRVAKKGLPRRTFTLEAEIGSDHSAARNRSEHFRGVPR